MVSGQGRGRGLTWYLAEQKLSTCFRSESELGRALLRRCRLGWDLKRPWSLSARWGRESALGRHSSLCKGPRERGPERGAWCL